MAKFAPVVAWLAGAGGAALTTAATVGAAGASIYSAMRSGRRGSQSIPRLPGLTQPKLPDEATSDELTQAQLEQREKIRRQAAAQSGRAGQIVTSGLGLTSVAPTLRRKLGGA